MPAIQVEPDVEHYFAPVIGRAGVCAAPSAEVEICGICMQIKGRTNNNVAPADYKRPQSFCPSKNNGRLNKVQNHSQLF